VNGHWLFEKEMDHTKEGFIYMIRDDYMMRFYIGKKAYYKGAEWRSYCSSSKLLKELFKARPREEFSFIVLEEYDTPGGLSYAESWTLLTIESPSRKDVYNTLVPKISWKSKEKISERHKKRLTLSLLNHDFFPGEKKWMS
jgi:hypothetical protein